MAHVRIEVQDQQGRWLRYIEIEADDTNVSHYLRRALKSPLTRGCRTARAIDVSTGQTIDLLQT